jgi:hypothetical protein
MCFAVTCHLFYNALLLEKFPRLFRSAQLLSLSIWVSSHTKARCTNCYKSNTRTWKTVKHNMRCDSPVRNFQPAERNCSTNLNVLCNLKYEPCCKVTLQVPIAMLWIVAERKHCPLCAMLLNGLEQGIFQPEEENCWTTLNINARFVKQEGPAHTRKCTHTAQLTGLLFTVGTYYNNRIPLVHNHPEFN